MHSARIGEVACTIIAAYHVSVPRYELWFAPEHVLAVWETLQAAGATPCGLEAVEALRVLDGIPLYGVDLNDRDLPQETAQMRALSFTKGCYLGQEIVERIRSRGKVHRQFRQFALSGPPATLPLDLRSADQPVGRITSTASLESAGLPETLALGFIRVEVMERNQAITYDGGVATALAAPPRSPGPRSHQQPLACRTRVSVSQRYKRRLENTMREKEPQFTVTDRRKFTAEGELREGQASESSPQPPVAERPQPPASSSAGRQKPGAAS